jgi:hypothetical protein
VVGSGVELGPESWVMLRHWPGCSCLRVVVRQLEQSFEEVIGALRRQQAEEAGRYEAQLKGLQEQVGGRWGPIHHTVLHGSEQGRA